MDANDTLKEWIKESNNIVFFGGAGVSTESHIPDFRSEGGLYKTKDNYSYPPEVMLSHTFFMEHTDDFFDFYRKKMVYPDAKPNDAHFALAKLEKMGKLKAVITQNIDGLHQSAGSKNVLELHGSILRNHCMKCHKSFGLDEILKSDSIPKCDKCGGTIKPDVVLYEEGLDMDIFSRAENYIRNADMFIVGGTSLVVYPAANLVNYYRGKKLVLINKSTTPYDMMANLAIHSPIGKVLKSSIDEIE